MLLLHTLANSIGAGPVNMKNLLLPPWPPTYNLSQSTMSQSCFGPARIGAAAPLTNASGQFMKHWGIVTLDFESQENIWGHHSPKDSDTMMLAQAAQMKEIAPDTKIWVYRNLAQASATSLAPTSHDLPPPPPPSLFSRACCRLFYADVRACAALMTTLSPSVVCFRPTLTLCSSEKRLKIHNTTGGGSNSERTAPCLAVSSTRG